MPGHNYTLPYNSLEEQLKYNLETGEIIEIYQQPTGPTDAVAMQHDVDYGSCAFRQQKYGENEKIAKTKQTVKWSSLLILFRGIKDNWGMRSRGTLSIQNKNLVWVTKNKTVCFLPTLSSQKRGFGCFSFQIKVGRVVQDGLTYIYIHTFYVISCCFFLGPA